MKKILMDYTMTLIILILISFVLPRMLPGNPVDALMGNENMVEISVEARDQLMKNMGLHQSTGEQLIKHFRQIISLDFGRSFSFHRNVNEMILEVVPWTLLLSITGVVISLLVGIVVGIESAYYRHSWFDSLATSIFMGISGFPQFFIGMMLLKVFAFRLGWFPLYGHETAFAELSGFSRLTDILHHLFLPSLTLALSEVSGVFYLVKSSAIVITGKKFYRSGMMKGYKAVTLKYHYLFKNVTGPLMQFLSMRLGKIMVGELVIEVVFSYPGVGNLIYKSVANRDYPLIQGLFFYVTFFVLLMSGIGQLISYKMLEKRGGKR